MKITKELLQSAYNDGFNDGWRAGLEEAYKILLKEATKWKAF